MTFSPYPTPKKILAMKLRALGDTVLMTAPLRELRRAFPQAQIHAAVLTPWAPLLEGHTAVDHVWKYDRQKERSARAKTAARLALKLRKERFDCVVCFHASPSAAMIAFATGAKLRSIHFHGHHDRNRYSTVTIPGKGILKPIIERDMDALRALGIEIPEGCLPLLSPSSSEIRWARDYLSRFEFREKTLCLALGASRPTKSWPMDRFASIAVQWSRRTGGPVLAIAGLSEESLKTEFLKAVGDQLSPAVSETSERIRVRARILAETRFSIRELAAILSESSILLGNDSGPRHLAVAVGTPTVTLFGPEHPYEWHPYPIARHPYFFVKDLDCRRDALPGMPPWCGLDLCKQEHYKCMRLIGTDAVLEKCIEVSKRGPV